MAGTFRQKERSNSDFRGHHCDALHCHRTEIQGCNEGWATHKHYKKQNFLTLQEESRMIISEHLGFWWPISLSKWRLLIKSDFHSVSKEKELQQEHSFSQSSEIYVSWQKWDKSTHTQKMYGGQSKSGMKKRKKEGVQHQVAPMQRVYCLSREVSSYHLRKSC